MAILACLLTLAASVPVAAQMWRSRRPPPTADSAMPQAEFHMARLIYGNNTSQLGRGFGRPWWAIDWPEAEAHFLPAVKRLTRIEVSDDSIHLELTDDRVFDYPWLFAQQVGYWTLNDAEILRLRQYLERGGFLVVDDFHGPQDWQNFEVIIRQVLPGRPILELPADHELLHVFYDLDERTQIPGERHLRLSGNDEVVVDMPYSPPHWRGIFDDDGRLMVAINFNMDMGDAWEHADDWYYPEPMTALAYRFGINYIIYAITH
ncbi:MAG: DUF4159 domain-containing protein [Gammaproteobacteria bacterium]|nr:DUF4159 domain-containing protein [Gammaproteobacteria bacterium]